MECERLPLDYSGLGVHRLQVCVEDSSSSVVNFIYEYLQVYVVEFEI